MESERESHLGICYECSVKELDSSEKQVTHCDLCDKWFCERHRKPKFPFFVDWDTISDVQGNPEIKALFYTEYKREGGHPDFVYWRKTFEALDIEEKTRNELIKQAIDKMEEANRERRIERWEKEAKEKEAQEAKEELITRTGGDLSAGALMQVSTIGKYKERSESLIKTLVRLNAAYEGIPPQEFQSDLRVAFGNDAKDWQRGFSLLARY